MVFEDEVAEYHHILAEAHSVIAQAWKCRRQRLHYLLIRNALVDIQRSWRRARARKAFHREIDARVKVMHDLRIRLRDGNITMPPLNLISETD